MSPQARSIWEQRERITEALLLHGVTYKVVLELSFYSTLVLVMYLQYDVSLPLSVLYELVEITRERCKDMAKCTVGYGHIGDGMFFCGWYSDPVLAVLQVTFT